MKNEEYIKSFLKEIAAQNNRCTAAPYFYVIRSRIKSPRPVDNCDEVGFYDSESQRCYETKDVFIDEMKKEGMSEDEIAKELGNLYEYGFSYEWIEHGMFLTESDAENHLKTNHYHYSEKAHTYVKHCWRAPAMEKFFVSLFNYFNVEKGNLDLRNIER